MGEGGRLAPCLVVAREREEKEKEEGKGREGKERRKYFLLMCLDIGKKK